MTPGAVAGLAAALVTDRRAAVHVDLPSGISPGFDEFGLKLMRVLCICPRFSPVSAADGHRLRMVVKYAEKSGWDAEILALEPGDARASVDGWLDSTLPPGLRIHRVKARKKSYIPVNTLAFHVLPEILHQGNALLSTGRFDLVFFSTTEFLVHLAGPRWKERFGVPFCMDFQDPWVNDYYRLGEARRPPGGWLKYWVMNRIHRWAEAKVVRSCSGFLSVSPGYLDDLGRRHGKDVRGRPRLVRPFPGEPAELDAVGRVTEPDTGIWRYIGRGGSDMHRALKGFLAAWRKAREAGVELPKEHAFEAVGTSYAPAGTGLATLAPVALSFGLADSFSENTDRILYSAALRLLKESGALVVFGSDDSAYTASKIYPYLLARRPLLAIFQKSSSVVELMERVGGGVCVTFDDGTSEQSLADEIYRRWFAAGAWRTGIPLDEEAFSPYTARRQAAELGDWFGKVIGKDAEAR